MATETQVLTVDGLRSLLVSQPATTSPLHHFMATSPHGYIITWLHHHTVTSPHGYITTWLHHLLASLSHFDVSGQMFIKTKS